MGNNDCRIFNDYDDKEIVTGKGVYSFKKSHRATNESEKIFYGKEERRESALLGRRHRSDVRMAFHDGFHDGVDMRIQAFKNPF